MGGFLDKPKTTIHNDSGTGHKLFYAVSSMQGWRCEMEDTFFAASNLGVNLKDWSFFAVFDGHAGRRISQHCASNLVYEIIETQEFKNGDYVNGIRTGFLNIDETMRHLAFEVRKLGGTTAVCAFVSPTQVYIANCGDSRAVLCRQATPVFATQDHKPVLPDEKERIRKAGGNVLIKRVNGVLAVSRALGDYDFKKVPGMGQCEQLVSPEPEIFCESRQDSDEFLVLACDGIWDVMSNEDVCSFIHSRLKVTKNLECVANELIETCLHKGSKDNMTTIIITFPGAPTFSEEALELDVQLEKEIEKVVKEEIEGTEIKNCYDLLSAVKQREIEGLPPGGGIHSKFNLIKRIYKEHFPEKQCEEVRNYFYNC